MFYIDEDKCIGCGACANDCSQRAINIENDVAVINQARCSQCGNCVAICPNNAIREVVPVHAQLGKGGEKMLYRYGRGFGFRGVSPPWPYAGRGRGGLPRCWYPGVVPALGYTPAVCGRYSTWGPGAYPSYMPQEQEVDFLKEESSALRRRLEEIEARIKELEAKQQ